MRLPAKLIAAMWLAAAVAGGVVLFGGSAARGAGAATPLLRVVRIYPLIVGGRNFRSAERVTVTAYLPRSRRRAEVAANADGAFTVRLGPIRGYDPCEFTVSVEARGSRGSRAVARTLPRLCAPRQQP